MVSRSQPATPMWLPYAGFCLAIAGIIYQGGVITNQVAQNTRRIDQIEAKYSQQWATVNEMNMRGVSNQTKLDFLVEQTQKRQIR